MVQFTIETGLPYDPINTLIFRHNLQFSILPAQTSMKREMLVRFAR